MIEISVWQWDLDCRVTAEDQALLSQAEQARAARFVVPHAGPRFIAARIAMRRTLGALTGCDPAALQFEVTPAGKPFLPGGPEFNLSHSGRIAMFAVASLPVGIDVEAIRPIEAGVARLVFTQSELDYLDSLTPSVRQAAFYRGWTRKEAHIKATGGTLADLKHVEVLPEPSGPLGIKDLPAPEGYAAALAAPGSVWTVTRQAHPAWQTA